MYVRTLCLTFVTYHHQGKHKNKIDNDNYHNYDDTVSVFATAQENMKSVFV